MVKGLLALLLVLLIVAVTWGVIQWLRNGELRLRLGPKNDWTKYLTRRERREYARALAKRQLSEAEDAYFQRLDAMLNTPLGVLPEKDR